MTIEELTNTGAFWQMSMAEKASVLFLVNEFKHNVAIEVGSYCGGFTRALGDFCKVFSLDIDHTHLSQQSFVNDVEFIPGNSSDTLPALIERLQDDAINLVLIDADHSYDAVLADINAVLKYRPRQRLLLLMHDSWDAGVRKAIDDADWNANPFVHAVEKDFCVGDLGPNGFVGGLAVALLGAPERKGELVIRSTHDYMYQTCLKALRRP